MIYILLLLILFFVTWIVLRLTINKRPKRKQRIIPTDIEVFESPILDKYNLEQFRANKAIYLSSIKWQDKRKQVLSRDNNQCILCHTTNQLEIHHLYYTQLGDEPLSHLVTLCRNCHQSRHNLLGIPQTYQEYLNFKDTL